MTYKTIKLEGVPEDVYTTIICKIKFKITSDTEIFVMQSLVKSCTNLSITLNKEYNKHIAAEVGITTNLLSTTIHRLEKHGCIRRMDKTVLIHPAFQDLQTTKGIVFTA